ncbi:MAG: molybdate ABC transporter substrate-binding protein [Nostoc sp. NOS(2021)]|uniref:molybdate ABC transporter substrate-binding protein n=1 Tax=Nostoc sp. NOS(2021) TaxID=2815407 RepID=UPI0025D583F7|nr:molybdate ABC transporter substrate-binding protein [Nostoc sp. NOS(2021)]MBN3899356.1 molybdate ABC transporter substrate-binding protein [Nostoc sp. NOS(2021)]
MRSLPPQASLLFVHNGSGDRLFTSINTAFFTNFSPASSVTTLNVYAAVSLTNALNSIKTQYQNANPGVNVVYTFGASGTLLSQIQAGASADIFISAATDQIDVLQNATPSKLVAGSRKNVVKNSLVLIVPTTPAVSKDKS